MHITVVIPFFQRQPGLLARAIDSVLVQGSLAQIEVIVVDDGSPVAGESELALVKQRQLNAVKLIRQANGGVAKARNTGLDAVNLGTTIVTFLDADDAWLPNRTDNILRAFKANADCYFSDYYRLGGTRSRFEWAGLTDMNRLPIDGDVDVDLHWYHDDMMAALARGRCPVGTSTLAVRWNHETAGLRFFEGFHRCAEDHHFYAQLFSKLGANAKIAISTKPDVECDVGVGLETSAQWGTVAGLQRIVDSSRFHTMLATSLDANEKAKLLNSDSLRDIDTEFFGNYFITAIKNKDPSIDLLKEYFSLRPVMQLGLMRGVFGLIKNRIQRKS